MKRVNSIFHYSGKNRDQDETHRRTMEVLTSRDDTGEAAEDEATLNEESLRDAITFATALDAPPTFTTSSLAGESIAIQSLRCSATCSTIYFSTA